MTVKCPSGRHSIQHFTISNKLKKVLWKILFVKANSLLLTGIKKLIIFSRSLVQTRNCLPQLWFVPRSRRILLLVSVVASIWGRCLHPTLWLWSGRMNCDIHWKYYRSFNTWIQGLIVFRLTVFFVLSCVFPITTIY